MFDGFKKTLHLGPRDSFNPPAGAFKVISSNIAGGMACDHTMDCIGIVNDQIDLVKPNAVGVVEICYGDMERFASQHQNMEVFYEPLNAWLEGCGGLSKGAMLAGVGLTAKRVYDLPGDYTPPSGKLAEKNYKLLAATTPQGIRVGAVHLRADQSPESVAARMAQINELIHITRNWGPHALVGDWNSRSQGPEIARMKEAGYIDAKPGHVDHVMLKGGKFEKYDGEFVPQSTSDHPLLKAWATIR